MEHTEYDIKNIDFGNRQLDSWISDEDFFRKLLLLSKPLRWVLGSAVYCTLLKLEQIVPFSKLDQQTREDYIAEAERWAEGNECKDYPQIAKCLLVLSTLADKRLKITSGI